MNNRGAQRQRLADERGNANGRTTRSRNLPKEVLHHGAEPIVLVSRIIGPATHGDNDHANQLDDATALRQSG